MIKQAHSGTLNELVMESLLLLPIAANNRARQQHKLFLNYQIRTNVTSSKVGTLRFKFNVSACLSSEEVTHLQLDNYRNIYNNFYRTDKRGAASEVPIYQHGWSNSE